MAGELPDPSTIIVGIPTLNEEAHIEDCIRSLLSGDDALSKIKIVVSDGGSTDRTREIVAEMGRELPNIELIDNPGKLQSAAINRVIEVATKPTHEILVRCDAHAVYPPNYVLDIAREMRERDAQSVATVMDAYGTSCFGKGAAWVVDTLLGSGGSGHRGGSKSGWVAHGHHAGMDISWFNKVGGYNPPMTPNEDAEYDYRLTEAGGKIWLAANVRFDYAMRETPQKLWKQYLNYGRGRARNYLVHRMRPQLRQVVPVLNLVALIGSLFFAVLFHPIFLAFPLFYVSVLALSSLYFAATRGSLCGLWAGPAAGIMHLAWAVGFFQQMALGR